MASIVVAYIDFLAHWSSTLQLSLLTNDSMIHAIRNLGVYFLFSKNSLVPVASKKISMSKHLKSPLELPIQNKLPWYQIQQWELILLSHHSTFRSRLLYYSDLWKMPKLQLNTYIPRLAFPLILSNITIPLLGLANTIIVGHLNHQYFLAAIGLGVMIFNLLFWGFGCNTH